MGAFCSKRWIWNVKRNGNGAKYKHHQWHLSRIWTVRWKGEVTTHLLVSFADEVLFQHPCWNTHLYTHFPFNRQNTLHFRRYDVYQQIWRHRLAHIQWKSVYLFPLHWCCTRATAKCTHEWKSSPISTGTNSFFHWFAVFFFPVCSILSSSFVYQFHCFVLFRFWFWFWNKFFVAEKNYFGRKNIFFSVKIAQSRPGRIWQDFVFHQMNFISILQSFFYSKLQAQARKGVFGSSLS